MDATRFDHLVKSASKSSSRRQAIKVLGGGVAAGLAAVAGLRVRDAAARSRQSSFVHNCTDNGGVSSRVRRHVVRCTYACGFYRQCNFNFDPPRCYEVLLTC